MKRLRPLSPRPQLVVSERAVTVGTVTDQSRIGRAGPFGNERLVNAVATNKGTGPRLLVPPRAIQDHTSCYLGDPDGNLIGDRQAVWVHRYAAAGITADTRRL